MEYKLSLLLAILLLAKQSYAPPINAVKNLEEDDESSEYENYLKQAIEMFGGDPEFIKQFRAMLNNETANMEEFLHENATLRDKEEELQRIEVEKIRRSHRDKDHDADYLDSIKRLEELDRTRQKKYEEHVKKEKEELAKEYAESPENVRRQLIMKKQEEARRHKERVILHYPGSLEHWQDSWERLTGMPISKFNERIMFQELDLNNDGALDLEEIEAFVEPDLERIYDTNDEDFDDYEMERDRMEMRHIIVTAFDANRDYLIDLDEFIAGLKKLPVHPNRWKSAQEDEDEFESHEDNIKRVVDELHLSMGGAQHDVPNTTAETTTQSPQPQHA